MSDISSDLASRGITVTIKYGKGYEEPWAVFRGSVREVREDIVAYFGGNDEPKLPLSQLVLNLAGEAVAMQVCAAGLGAVAIPSSDKPASTEEDCPLGGCDNDESGQPADGDPWASGAQANEPAAPENPNQALFDTIKSIGDVDTLRRLWAENQEAFTADEALLDAWKNRGKELSK